MPCLEKYNPVSNLRMKRNGLGRIRGNMNGISLRDIIFGVLQQDNRLWNKEKTELNRRLLFDLLDNFDETLLQLFLQNKKIREKFFVKIKDVYVFKINDFKFFIEENKIDNSYTQYKNRIGLSDGEEFIKFGNKVVLDFPFKDCVLQGGQTTEEGFDIYFEYEPEKTKIKNGKKVLEPAGYRKKQTRRKEIFFNQILAQDEIDRLFEEKAFVNWKRYTKDGVKEVTEIRRDDDGLIRENLVIRGNNLLALHSIKSQFREKVKLIYIDPPYYFKNEKDEDAFKYNTNFKLSTWLTFMKNRLEVAKELLKDEGAIFVQINDDGQAYLKILMDEIFGMENFKECISVKTGSESGVNAINVLRGEQLFKVKEHILYYAKNSAKHRFKPIYVKGMSYNEDYRLEVKKSKNGYEVKDIYKEILRKLYNQDNLRGLSNEQKYVFYASLEEYCLANCEHIYALKKDIQKSGDDFKKFARENKAKNIVEEYKTYDDRIILVYKGGMLTPLKDRVVEENGSKYYGTLISDFWWDIGATPYAEGSVELKSGKKPEKLLKRIISLCTDPGDIVMDFFLGSGSTAAVSMKMQRQFIGIEQLDYQENDSIIRLQNVIKGDQTGISKDSDINWQGGGDFIYCELAKWNEKAKEEINMCNSLKELIDLFDILYEKYFLNYNLKINEFKNKVIKEKTFIDLPLEEQKRIFLAMLDLNQMYVLKSEMADSRYGISEQDQKLTCLFYQEE